MSLKSLLMPMIAQRMLAHETLLRRRAKHEKRRIRSGEPHRIRYFHQVDDPYSALAGAATERLAERYDITLEPWLVGPPTEQAAPDRDRLIAYSRRDAQALARRLGLMFDDPGHQPTGEAVALAQALLTRAIGENRFAPLVGAISHSLWHEPDRLRQFALPPSSLEPASPAEVADALAAGESLRKRLGHYLGAVFHYAGEWYWGLDRLHHLERRLQDLGAHKPGIEGLLFEPGADLAAPVELASPLPIDFYFSFRSPYTAIVAKRVFELGRLSGATVRPKAILPMVMRGMPVLADKRAYIAADAAREARLRGVPFGRLNDPVGRPVERAMAVLAAAERIGRAAPFILAFLDGVWAQGIDAGSDRGLRRIVETAGLDWPVARDSLADEAWRLPAEQNRAEMFSLGLWGVPSFRAGEVAVWGQDRLWAIQEAVLASPRQAT